MISPIGNSYAAKAALRSSRSASSTSFGAAMTQASAATSDTATISDAAKAKSADPMAKYHGEVAVKASPEKVAGSGKKGEADSADSIAKLNEALSAFKKEASLTPAQRARRDVLKTMNLTEDAIKAMPPEQQKATEQKIAAEVARRLRLSEGGKDQMTSACAAPTATDALTLSV